MIRGTPYRFFTAGDIRPRGWLLTQLLIQAEGLAGDLDRVWPDVRDSAWIGGDREGWERVPYWLDGFIPLAYLIRDEGMIRRAKRYVDAILDAQREDGWICPCADKERADYDTWAVLLIAKVLALYADCSGDDRIEGALGRCLKQFHGHLSRHTLRNWGAARWFEGLIPICWLYERTGEDWLIDLALRLRAQGFDWRALLESGVIARSADGWDYYSHIVNIAMMLKSEALLSRFTGQDPEAFALEAVRFLDEAHGTAAGHFNGDECLSGTSPIHGAETCSVVELMWSYENLFNVTGDPMWLDRLENAAFNSLPAAVSPDMWAHQYDQMANQAACYPMDEKLFRTNGPSAHVFGLEPEYGCCTANFGQGWPKFALTAFMRSGDGIACCALCPAEVTAVIGDAPVTCEMITDYPFRDRITCRVRAGKPAEFTLSVRIPACAKAAFVDGAPAVPGRFFDIRREWTGETTIGIDLVFEPEIIKRPGAMAAVRRGPLLYALPVREKWERVEYVSNGVERKYPYCDWRVTPQSKWNMALAGGRFTVREAPFIRPFDPEKPPIALETEAAEISWGFHNGHCDEQPASRVPMGPAEKVLLIPYGCTALRMTEMPLIEMNGPEEV